MSLRHIRKVCGIGRGRFHSIAQWPPAIFNQVTQTRSGLFNVLCLGIAQLVLIGGR